MSSFVPSKQKSSKTRNCRRYWMKTNPIATTIGTYTKCDPRSNLPTFKSHGKDPKVWKMVGGGHAKVILQQTTHRLIPLKWWRTHEKHWIGKYYRTRRTLQTAPRPTITFSHRWDTHSKSSASPILKKSKNGSSNGWFASKDKKVFWNGIHDLPERWAKCVESNGQYFE